MILFLVGLILGVLSGTVTESVGHRLVGHPTIALKKFYLKYPRLFSPFLHFISQHVVVHHQKTFRKNFFEQFDDEQHKLQLDRWISTKLEPKLADLIWRENYHLALTGAFSILRFAIPFFLGPVLIGMAFGFNVFLGSLIFAFAPVWFSVYIHPLIHIPTDTARAHSFVQWLMKTRYMGHAFRNHYLHHRHPKSNFNLFIGGDYLLFIHRKATAQDEQELATILPEFERRIRQGLPASSSVRPEKFEISYEEYLKGERDYLALEHPSFAQRFEYQLWKSRMFDLAQSKRWDNVLDSLSEGKRDFGMKVYDKGLCLEKWENQKEFALESYGCLGSDFYYRGVRLECGDLFLTNQANDSDGLFSTFVQGHINFSHVALFTLLKRRGRCLPAVIEMNEYGVRAIPLKAFLSDRFNSYVEVFRLKERLSEEAKAKIALASFDIIRENHGFDIFHDTDQSHYLNCSRTVSEIYRRAGLQGLSPLSRYCEKTQVNLRTMGIRNSLGKLLHMPDDVGRDPRFQLVGVVDNGNFDDMMARGLMRERIQELWRTEILDPKSFPLDYKLNKFVIQSIQEKNWFAPLLLRLIGLNEGNFPSGPNLFLAITPVGNRLMSQGTRLIKQKLAPYRQHILKLATWDQIQNDSRIRVEILNASAAIHNIYVSAVSESEPKHVDEKHLRAY